MAQFWPAQGKFSPEGAKRDAQMIAGFQDADFAWDIGKVERRLAQVRYDIGSLERQGAGETETVQDDRVTQLEAKIERLEAQIDEHAAAGNHGTVTSFTHARDAAQRSLDDLLLRLGDTPAGKLKNKLAELRAEEDRLDRELFKLTEAHDDLARRHDARCAAEDAAARLAARRREFEATAFAEWLAGEQPCE